MSTTSPGTPKKTTEKTTASVEEIEAALATRRAALTEDLEVLGTRLAPAALRNQATQAGQDALHQARSQVEELRGNLTDRVHSLLTRDGHTAVPALAGAYGIVPGQVPAGRDLGGRRTQVGTVFEPSPLRRVQERLQRLVDDARDGDPTSLAVVTGAVLALAGLSAVAVVKAVRR